jgi:hypothetical protein
VHESVTTGVSIYVHAFMFLEREIVFGIMLWGTHACI